MKKFSVYHMYHVPKCISSHKAIAVITGRAHCFQDYTSVMPILLLGDFSILCVADHL